MLLTDFQPNYFCGGVAPVSDNGKFTTTVKG
jgi:hypothetical protein